MKKNLIITVIAVLIFTHVIPPYNISSANEEINECEKLNFTVQTIVENDKKIVGTGMSSDQLTVEFITKNKTEIVNVNGNFELAVEEEFVEENDEIIISNEYFKVETKVASEGTASQSIQSSQYVECPVIVEEESEPEEAEMSKPVEAPEQSTDEVEVSEPDETSKEAASEEDVSNSEETREEAASEAEVSESEETPKENASVKEFEEVIEHEEIWEEETNEEEISENEDIKESNIRSRVPYESNVRYIRKEIINAESTQTLADVSLLTNVEITSSIDGEQPPEGTSYNLDLLLSGSSLEDVELVDTNRVVAFSIPELAGQMTATGPANVSVDLTLVNLDDLPILGNVVGGLTGTLTTTVNGVLSLVSDLENSLIPDELITIEGVDSLQGSLDALNNIEQALADALQYNGTAPVTVNADGTITVDMTDGLGNNLDTAVNGVVIQVLNDLITSLNGVSISILPEAEDIPLLGSVVRLLNGTINTILGGLTGLVGTVTDTLAALDVPGLTAELARVQLLGSTNVDLNLAVNNPVQFEPGADNIVPVYASVVNTALIDANLIGNGTGQSELVFPEQRDETNPIINTVDIKGNSNDGYIVSGTGEEPGDRVEVTNEDGNIVGSGDILEDGTFSIDIIDDVFPDEILYVQAYDEAENKSEIHEVIVPILKLVTVPTNIDFGTIEIENGESIFGRKSDGNEVNNVIEIKDTRNSGGWVLTAKAPNLSAGNNVLDNELIYIRNGEEVIINDVGAIVAESSDENIVHGATSETITWNNNDGLFLKLNPIFAQADTEYSTTIEWTLTDGPSSNN